MGGDGADGTSSCLLMDGDPHLWMNAFAHLQPAGAGVGTIFGQ
jgi:hypothetical protein